MHQKFGRRSSFHIIATCMIGIGMHASAMAATASFPSKPIRIIAPFSVGSGVDTIARIYADELSRQFKVPVIVENKEGAGGMIGSAFAAKLPADGYNMLLATTPFVVAPITQRNVSYDPIKDFDAVARIATNPLAFVISTKVPVKTMGELISYAKENPGKLTYASSGIGTPSQLEMESLKSQLGLDILEIPYKSNAQALTDLLAGTVSIYYTVQSTSLSNMKSGALRALAVGSTEKTQALPEVPTVADSAHLPGYEAVVWYGLVAPKGTPKDLIAKLESGLAEASKSADVIRKIRSNGFEPSVLGAADFQNQMEEESEKWASFTGKTK
ncbi:Bug family tripartite tricarboxylate transporter substrate binding protein [Advenella kashmirensis]